MYIVMDRNTREYVGRMDNENDYPYMCKSLADAHFFDDTERAMRYGKLFERHQVDRFAVFEVKMSVGRMIKNVSPR